jgi:hypothetical protein
MIRGQLIPRPTPLAIAAAALVASGASAMPVRDVGAEVASHEATTRHRLLLPDRIDAAAHAATIRGIGAVLTEHACASRHHRTGTGSVRSPSQRGEST